MPNHIMNKLTVSEGDYDLSAITSFSDIEPMPKDLIDAPHDSVAIEVENILDSLKLKHLLFVELHKEVKDLYEKHPKDKIGKLLDNYEKYGYTNWYKWAVVNWGTKWDMYDVDCQDNILTFNTAWTAPIQWYMTLAKTLPEGVSIKVEYASEDIGSVVGEIILTKDSVEPIEYKDNSYYAFKKAIELLHLEDEVKCIDGEWVWLDDIEDEE